MALMTMKKKKIESFKAYAHRWRDIASQVQPHLTKKITFIFVNTLPDLYYDKMIRNAMRNFTEMVWSKELIKHGIKNKKIEGKPTSAPPAKKAIPSKKKERDAHVIFVYQQSRGKHLMPASLPIL